MHRKWVKFWRKTIDSAVWKMTPLHFKVWTWILLSVDHKTGSKTTTLDHIAERVSYEEWGVERTPDRKTILKILRRFEEGNMILRESHKRFTKITVVNWRLYNPKEEEIATQVPYSLPYQVPYQVPQQEQEVLPKKSKEVDQMQLQIQDQKITPVGVTVNPVSDLGNLCIELGLPDPYSWIGGLQKKFGAQVCRSFLEDQKLKGVTIADFKDAKAFKAYFTAAIMNRVKEIEVAAAVAAKPKWKIFNGYDGSPILEPEKRLKYILKMRQEYPAWENVFSDPDKNKPGCTWALPDEVVRKAIEEAKNEAH